MEISPGNSLYLKEAKNVMFFFFRFSSTRLESRRVEEVLGGALAPLKGKVIKAAGG
jgi:hypothetical protein